MQLIPNRNFEGMPMQMNERPQMFGMPMFLGYYWRGNEDVDRNRVFDLDPFTFWYWNFKYESNRYQQHPFFFSCFFLLFNLVVLTSTGINLHRYNTTFPPVCSRSKPGRSSRKPPQRPDGSWRWSSSALSWDASPKIHWHLTVRPIFRPRGRSCCPPKWRGIFQVPWELLGWEIRWSRTRCYRRTNSIGKYSLVCYVVN